MLGLGCMRLSTEPDRDDQRSIAVLHAALDAGVTLLDTADAYCRDDSETGHNERLIAKALAEWRGDRSAIQIASKGGLTRPAGEWIPDGRGRHLAAACEASCRALNVARIDLYQLHAPDPRTSLATSVRALAALKRQGLIDRVGLCNVTVGQLEEARRIVDVTTVQVELNFWNDSNFLSGIVDHCIRNGIQVIASRPLGGVARRPRTASDPTLTALAEQHRATPSRSRWRGSTTCRPPSLPSPVRHVWKRPQQSARSRAFSSRPRIAPGSTRSARRRRRFATPPHPAVRRQSQAETVRS
jgi:aryl-alcohol dehydrogenase-like predicted oxidoreductase